MPDPFDFTTLQDISAQASARAEELPAQETTFIDSLNELSNQQQNLRTSTMTAKSNADQKASSHVLQNQAVQKKMLAADANPFHDIVAFFDEGTQSSDELLAEQQQISHSVQTLANNYQAVASENQFKQQSIQAQIDKIKTIEAVRSGNTGELASLLSTFKQSSLNQNAIVMDELDKYTLDELHANVQKNTTPYEDGLVQLAYWNRQSLDAKRREASAKSADKRVNNQDWMTIHSPSVAHNKASIAAAEEAGKDIININGRNMPIGDIAKWNEENQAPIADYMASSAFLATKQIEAYSTITQMENLLPAVLGSKGHEIAASLRIPYSEIPEDQQVGILTGIQNGLNQVPVDLQADFAQLTKLRLQYSRSQKDRSALGVTKRANLETAMIHTAKGLRDNLGKIMINKYGENEQAVAGVNEFIATGKIDNATSATAIIQSQALTSSGMALDASSLDTYYEGSLSLLSDSMHDQYQAVYDQENANATAKGTAMSDFQSWLTAKTKKAPPDEFIMRKAVEANARSITANAYGKIANIHLASALRNFAGKYKEIPEVANLAVQMQDGVQLAGVLADPDVQAPKEIMTLLAKLEADLKQKKILKPDADLVNDFKMTALDRELVGHAVSILKPKNELTSSVDTLLFRGHMDTMYMKNIAKNFSQATVQNITARANEVATDNAAVNKIAAESGNPILRDMINQQKPVQ